MIIIYNFLLLFLTPFLKFYFKKRYIKGKETIISLEQKFTNYKVNSSILDKNKKTLWLHAVSVGETLSVIPLINKLATTNNFNLILTTTTITSQKISKQRLHKNIIHQFAPLDKITYVNNFLNFFKPDLAIWVESELWPNMIEQTHKRKIPMILLNARISDKNYFKRSLYKLFAKPLLNKFSLILPQEKKDLLRIKKLTNNHDKIKYLGNLKLASPLLPYNQQELTNLQTKLASRTIFLAASTHLGEEEIIADIHNKLRQTHHNLLTIIVPRHPHRGTEISESLTINKKLSVATRSNNAPITQKTDIYLADTIGELGLFYRLANLALIAGSLVKIGGHNPIEAVQLDCAIITGPFIYNFSDLYKDLLINKAIIISKNQKDLIRNIDNLLLNPNLLKDQINHAKKYMLGKNNILEKINQEITKLL